MPKQERKSSSAFTEAVRFQEISLSAEQKRALAKDTTFQSDYFGSLNALVSDGYRVVIKVDERTKGVMATCQNTDGGAQDSDTIYVIRSSSAAKALLYSVYAFGVVGDGAWPVNNGDADDADEDFPW